ncbi:hypothetical protein [Natronobacterium gregoryi]|uniref:Uncharacterized protein n=2 Tax=Natronobacterium gregoryi TaxID=44930 RepID=L0AC01_NATGS|nr:hypothetical protein [Natronobacterium gregoryi]AFZ71428.1 hypothetical protein Natgr_0164 [Natronobacterium gregoryi SP2]ELY66952.1 hypothetical protein C490_11968 [Natronobacterium gregoryi SP2]PLK21193.1 hypothetical protein CYV19_05080 [Natronobacterium gregoryi SP2]SFI84119.1 hypothetical protein SAMN05443661_1076 [Natronobacterium gregoryi]
MANSTPQLIVSGVLALFTILWLPYALMDWTLFEAVGSDYGIMLATLAFLLGVYDIAETGGLVEYPS